MAWTPEENKAFEDAVARYDRDNPNRWEKVAVLIPGKTVGDVVAHYKELESDVSYIAMGLVPFPQYYNSSSGGFTLDWETQGFKPGYCVGGKRGGSRGADQERKRGVPWTKEEHERFLLGLKKYGRGDWRNISRNYVTSRTPTQVASHAMKYFIRHNSGGKDKGRSSIHNITTVNLSTHWTYSCNFFMWGEKYEEFLRKLEIMKQRSDVKNVGGDVRRNENRYDVEIGEWMEHNSRLVKLVEQIKFLVTIIVFVMIGVLIVMICK